MKFKFYILLLIIPISVNANPVYLTDILKKSKSEIRWEPISGRGLIFKDDRTISFKAGSSIMVVDNVRLITGVSIRDENGSIVVNQESAKLLYRLLNFNLEHESIINDEELFNIPVIIIDPGHGGRDSGALGNHSDFNIKEKDVVLDISNRVVKKLSDRYKHKKILMTRDDDTFKTLEERVEFANEIVIGKKETVIYISVHANASINKKAEGYEVWFLPKDYRRSVVDGNLFDNENITSIVNAIKEDEISQEGERLADNILTGLSEKIGKISTNRGLKEEIWFVVRNARMASVLIEVGFVTNPEEGKRLSDSDYLQEIADGIYNGIENFVTKYESGGN